MICCVRSASVAASCGGQPERLVEAVGVQRLRAAEHRGERLQRDAHDVVERLLRGQRHARGLAVEAERARAVGLRAEALAHDRRPQRRAARNFATSSRRLLWPLKKKLSCAPKSSTSSPALDGGLHVGDAVGERERDLLDGVAARLAHVVAADRDGVPLRHLALARTRRCR